MKEITLAPAHELAQQIKRKELSAVELLELHLQRYQQHNPMINAIIFTQIDHAYEQAQAADKALALGKTTGPLHGLPMTIKDSYDWIGSPSTWGMLEMTDNYPEVNAVAVQRLLDAGAIIYGKSNVPLKLSDWQSFNEIYGTTNNPWDPTRTPGGSSGGAAAALATGMTSLEIGSDIGASIRNPAHFCGVYGHKPTMGIVPLQGHLLPGDTAYHDISVGGPLARSAEDLKLTLDILAGPTGDLRKAWQFQLPRSRKNKLSEFKVGVLMESPVCTQDEQLTEQLLDTVAALEKAGVQTDYTADLGFDWHRYWEVYLLLLRATTSASYTDEEYEFHLQSAAARKPDDTRYRAYLDKGITIRHRDWWALHDEREQMRLRWQAFFEHYDLLLCPTAASTAFVHDQTGERPDRTIDINGQQELVVDQLFWAGLSGVVYLPSTVVPAGVTRSGLPCGLQLIAPYLEDNTAIEFAQLMVDVVGGFQPPPGYQ